MKVNVCLDYECYKSKCRAKRNANKISNRIGKYETLIEIKELVQIVGCGGRTCTSAIFYNNHRDVENFKSMQIFILDFDDGSICK